MKIDMIRVDSIRYEYNNDGDLMSSEATFSYKNMKGDIKFDTEGYYYSVADFENEIAKLFNKEYSKEIDKAYLMDAIQAVLNL